MRWYGVIGKKQDQSVIRYKERMGRLGINGVM